MMRQRDITVTTPAGQDRLKTLASRLQPIFEKHRILRAIVFGSLARGEASRHSDLDQMLDRPFIATALKEGKVIYESEQKPPSG
jgi:predicted nucleotidyltransferase